MNIECHYRPPGPKGPGYDKKNILKPHEWGWVNASELFRARFNGL
jgi:hypothetical protein